MDVDVKTVKKRKICVINGDYREQTKSMLLDLDLFKLSLVIDVDIVPIIP
jgi:hypothetical protein